MSKNKKHQYVPQYLNADRMRTKILNQITKEWGHFSFGYKTVWEVISEDVGFTLEKPVFWKYVVSSSLPHFTFGFLVSTVLLSLI